MISKRILILGASGMLGHKLTQALSGKFDCTATLRGKLSDMAFSAIYDQSKIIESINAVDFDTIRHAIITSNPDVVVNCIGVIKQHPDAGDAVNAICINSLLPHQLYGFCAEKGIRLIHVSTDCVFSGREGYYSEGSIPDPIDLYGRSKLLGEIQNDAALTIRTSIIGRELRNELGLLEWFMSNKGKVVSGYSQAIFSGLTTLSLSNLIGELIEDYEDLSGVYHVSSDPISKLALLNIINRIFDLEIEIIPEKTTKIDRSLNSDNFRSETGWTPDTWEEMVVGLFSDLTPYHEWR